MYEELIKRLRYLAKVYSICGNENTQEYKLAVEAADAIEELQAEYNELLFRCGQAEALIDYYQTPPKEES